MKGAYALVLDISHDLLVNIGSLGVLSFNKGTWVYIGSAMGEGSTSLENRLQRHFSQEKSKFWHIDWLLDSGAIPVAAIWIKSNARLECQLSKALIKSNFFELGPQGFGSSDCQNNCGTHLFRFIKKEPVINILQEIFSNLGLNPQIMQT